MTFLKHLKSIVPNFFGITVLVGVLTSINPMTGWAETEPSTETTEEAPAKPSNEAKKVEIETRRMNIAVGSSEILEFPFEIGPIVVSEKGLFDFQRISEDGKITKLRLRGESPGNTDMILHDTEKNPRIKYQLRVTREDVSEIMGQLTELLGDIEGLKVKQVGGTIILDGDILLPKDMLRIIRTVDALKERDPKKKETPIKNLVTISKMTMNILAERIEREIGSPEITAKVINNNLILEGVAENNFEADRALNIAKTYLPEAFIQKTKGDGFEVKPKAEGGDSGAPAILDMMRVRPPTAAPPAQDIKVTVNYVELNNDYDRSFNFEWKPLMSDNSGITYNSSLGELSANLVSTISSLFPKLNAAKSHGHARVLKEQQIIVRDRSEAPATLDSSIDYYTPIVDAQGNRSLQAVPIQNSLKIRAATIPGSDSIDLGLQISLNQLLGQNQGAPIVARNSISTQVTIKNGESAALGGYAIDQAVSSYNRDTPRSTAGAPTGGGASSGGSPVFNLQRSKGFRRDKQQYIIFLTPEVIKTASSGTDDMTRKFRLKAGER